jgi:lipopolysaccharide/colanic/teichoic acid biosynthesis glycosyltransferase
MKASPRRRRLLVVGPPSLQELVRAARPADVEAIASAPCWAPALADLAWDEVVVDGPGLEELRASPGTVLGRRPVIVLDGDDVGQAADLLRRPISAGWAAWKRMLDVLVAGAAGVAALPVLAVAAVAIKVDSPGPVLFSQQRVGVGGVEFRFFKLRTMYRDNDDRAHREYCEALLRGAADPHEGLYKLVDDPRVTRVGRVLRRLSIDELPQLWNVLRGDMSLVGPRPWLPLDADGYGPREWRRLRVRPGLTGLWQVSGRSRLSAQQMIELDVQYWRDWTPGLDLSVLVRTPVVVARQSTA